MKIGELSKRSGVSVDALRFYEEKGLITPSSRTESGYRQYDADVIARVGFLKTAQALGFSLQEIAQVMPALTQGGFRLDEVKALLQDKLVALDQQIERLTQLRQEVLATLSAFQCDNATVVGPHDLMRTKP